MAALSSTITIVDKSNKVVSASKQLKGVFSEAKYAYLARKAEIKAEKKKKEEVELQKAIKACSIAEDEARSQASYASRPRRHESGSRRHNEYEDSRGHRHRSGSNSPTSPAAAPQVSLAQFNEQLYGQTRSAPISPRADSFYEDNESRRGSIRRTGSGNDLPLVRRSSTSPRALNRSFTAPADIDLDLAYGEYHEADLAPPGYELQTRAGPNAVVLSNNEKELSSLVLKCKMLLEEADCATQSVKAIIAHLQTNPEAMAAVALTLAEISNIASKVAPGALTALKGSAPAVIALLASPQFLVAVGVGVGVTIVMFGGYKIIKKIKAQTGALTEGPSPAGTTSQIDLGGEGNELLDVKELDRIEKWRRGIADTTGTGADAETGSIVSGYSQATSVEGEFITPFAAQSMGHLPLPPAKDKSRKSRGDGESKRDREGKEKRRHRKHHDSDRDGTVSEGGSSSAVRSEDGSSSKESSRRKKKESGKEVVLVKKPSPLRRMFTVA